MEQSRIFTLAMIIGFTATVSCNLLGSIHKNLEAMRRIQAEMQGKLSNTYPSYQQPSFLRVIGLDIGIGRGFFDVKNLLSYTNQMYKGRGIVFLVEQDGYGDIYAEFNGRRVQCSGLAQDRFKRCSLPAEFQPWTGRFTVKAYGRGREVSAGFSMYAKAFCPTPGLDGPMCKTDVDECKKFKGQKICSWMEGCMNTFGSYRCRCPPGYQVSAKDFRLCQVVKPKISTQPRDILALMNSDVYMDCTSSSTNVGITKWYIGSKLIAFRHSQGSKVLQPSRMSIFRNGTLFIKAVKYGDIGTFTCQVIVGREGAYVVHKLSVESKPIVEAGIYVGGKQLSSLNFNAGQQLSLRCKSLALPLPSISWSKNGKLISPSADVKLNKLQESTGIPSVKSIEVLELYFQSFKDGDAGEYICESVNKYGTSNMSIKLVK